MKVTIELDNKDWGKIAVAIQGALNYARNQLTEVRCDYNPGDHVMRLTKEVATLARIKASLSNQRKVAR